MGGFPTSRRAFFTLDRRERRSLTAGAAAAAVTAGSFSKDSFSKEQMVEVSEKVEGAYVALAIVAVWEVWMVDVW